MPPFEIQVFSPSRRTCARAVGRRGRGERRDVGAGLRLRQREGRDRLAVAHRRQIARLQLRRAEQRDRAGAEPLHGEGEVGEPVAERQDFAGEAERAHVEPRMQPAVRGRHHRLEEARLAQRLHARAAGGVDVVVRQRRQRGVGPARERVGEAAVVVVEERQRSVRRGCSWPSPPSPERRARARAGIVTTAIESTAAEVPLRGR